MRWTRLISACLILVFSGCDVEKTAKLEKENKELRAELERRKVVDIDTQAKCSKAAKEFFNEEWKSTGDTMLLDYTNHFNTSLGKCFILVEWHYHAAANKRGGWFNNVHIYDVYEHNKYAEVSENHDYDESFKEQLTTLRCEVDNAKCNSMAEFWKNSSHFMSE